MNKKEYHCLIAGLPDLFFQENKKPIQLSDFVEELKKTLSEKDYLLVRLLFLPIDNENWLNLLTKKDEFKIGGNYTQEFLEEQIKEPTEVEEYLMEFANSYKKEIPIFSNLSWTDQLTNLYSDYVLSFENEYIIKYFKFQLDINNILTALNCRENNLNTEKYLIGKNSVTDILQKNKSADFGLKSEFENIDEVLQIWSEKNILEREKKTDQMFWDFIENESFFHYFTIEKIIAFLLKLKIVERWLKLDKETGNQFFKKLLKSIEK